MPPLPPAAVAVVKQNKIILFASIFVVICATKEQAQSNGYIGGVAESIGDTIYGHQLQDNIAAESEISKRGTAAPATATAVSSESDGQTSQFYIGKLADGQLNTSNLIACDTLNTFASICPIGTSGSGSGSVIGYTTPNSFQQFYSPTFGQYGAIYAASPVQSSSSGTSPQVRGRAISLSLTLSHGTFVI